jgi:hypothetical protein
MSSAWKNAERQAVKTLGGKRNSRGGDFGQAMLDVEHPLFLKDGDLIGGQRGQELAQRLQLGRARSALGGPPVAEGFSARADTVSKWTIAGRGDVRTPFLLPGVELR